MESDETSATPELVKMIQAHEKHSQERYEHLMEKVEHIHQDVYAYKGEDKIMGEGINTDKVIVNAGGSDGGGGMQAAALVAALGQRNQGGDNAALIAALGGRNQGFGGGDGFGMGLGGGGLLGGLLFGALLGGRRGGVLGGGGDDCCDNHGGVSPAQAALFQTLMEGQSDLRAAVPTAALETTNAIQNSIAQLALGTQQGFANTKDAVQALALFQTGQLNAINQNVSDQGCKTREIVQAGTTAVLERISRFEIDELRHDRDRHERQVEVNALRSQVEITNTNTATNAQAQGQFQTQLQFQDLNRKFDQMCGLVQVIGNQVVASRQAQDIVNLGTMVASGGQQATSTAVK